MSRDAAEAARTRAIASDTRDLHRGVATNLLGYLLKLGNPVLLALVVRAYGAEAFGLYTFAQAMMLFAARVGVYGFDKGLLWSVPRQSAQNKRRGVRPALRATTCLGAGITLVVIVAAQPELLRYIGADNSSVLPLRIMAFSIILQGWMDVLVHASMGMRRMGAQVFAKETVVPGTFVIGALAMHALEGGEVGLAIAFLCSNVVGLGAAVIAFRGAFRGVPWPEHEGTWPDQELLRYSGPMWLTEMLNSLLQRVDTYALAFFTHDLALVGVYAVVTRFSNAIRQIRRSFDPIVLAIAAEISSKKDSERLAASYSHATFLVGITQIPVFAFMWVFAEPIMRLFGPEFAVGAVPLVILCAFWMVNSAVSLSGIVVTAYGHSRLTLQTVLLALPVLCISCWLLIPPFGVVGAACSVAVAYAAQSTLQLVQMRVVTGSWNYRKKVLVPLRLGAYGAAAAGICWLATAWLGVQATWVAHALSFAAFFFTYGAGVHRLWRQGQLARTSLVAHEPPNQG